MTRRGPGDARGDGTGQHLPALLQLQRAVRRDRGPADLPGSRARQRGAAGVADGDLLEVASYAELIGHPGQAKVAFAVADHMHHKGIATLLLEHLVSLARSRQIDTGARLPGTIVPSETAYGAVMKHIDHAGGELAARD